jgi:hypothetical protein
VLSTSISAYVGVGRAAGGARGLTDRQAGGSHFNPAGAGVAMIFRCRDTVQVDYFYEYEQDSC